MSGSVSDDFEFGGSIDCGEKAIHSRHSGIFQLDLSTLATLKDRQRPDDHDGRIAKFERQISDPFF